MGHPGRCNLRASERLASRTNGLVWVLQADDLPSEPLSNTIFLTAGWEMQPDYRRNRPIHSVVVTFFCSWNSLLESTADLALWSASRSGSHYLGRSRSGS